MVSDKYFSDKIKFISLGETHKIGASAFYLKLGKWGVLLDAGLDPNPSDEIGLPNYEIIEDQPVNAILISHAHLDHLGSLPVALQYFPHARIYMTPATVLLSEKLLFHYLKVQERRMAKKGVKSKPLYTSEQLENILHVFQSFDYNFPFKLHGFLESNIEVTFWDAGHILGSAGIEINWRNRKIFYTGNTKKSKQFILKGAKYPSTVDTLISETTYGADSKAPSIRKSLEKSRFVFFLKERIKLGGAILIPVFALGRTQEILVLLYYLMKKNRLPAVPIYITGLGYEINKIYDQLLHKTYPDFVTKKLRAITTDSLRNRHFRRPSILLATSGMMIPDTLSYEIAGDFLQERRNGIAFVGWADPEMPAGAFRESRLDRIHDLFGIKKILCEIDIFHFSAHSDRNELISMIAKLKPNNTILCHGDSDAQDWMYNKIKNERLSREVFIPKFNEYLEI